MTAKELHILNKIGWVELNYPNTDKDLISLASSIGQIESHINGSKVYSLKPKNGLQSIKGTFSNRFGFGKFPLHTDTAYYTRPVRYMVLSSEKKSASQTSVLPFNEVIKHFTKDEEYKAHRSIYKIRTSEGSFFTSLFFNELGNQGIKYDPTCMIPANNSAKNIDEKLQEIFAMIEPDYIKWTGENILIIDNWKTLHGRTSVNYEENRVLKRIYIN